LPLWRAAQDREGEADTLTNVGASYLRTGRPKQALEAYLQAEAVYRQVGARESEGVVLNNLGDVYVSIGEPHKALEHYQRSLAIRREIGDKGGEANTLGNLGSLYNTLGERQKVLDFYNQALAIWQTLGNRRSQAIVLNNICSYYDGQGEPSRALEYCSRSLPLRREVGDRRGEASTLDAMAQIYQFSGEPQKALDRYEEALRIRRDIKDIGAEANTLNSIGTVYDSLGEAQKALDYYNQALPVRRAVSDRRGEASTLTNIGSIYYETGEREKALDYFNQALPLWRASGDRSGEAKALGDIAKYHSAQGDRTKAAELFNQTLALSRAVGDRQSEGAALAYLGDTYAATNEQEKALDSYNQALAINRTLGNSQSEASTLYGLAAFERNRGQLNEARAQIEAALKIVESQRLKLASQSLRASYLASVQRFYEFYIDLLIRLHELSPQQGYEALALEVSERARARSLLELLIEARADIRQGVDPTLLAREQELQQQLSAKTEARIRLLNGKHTTEQAVAAAQEIEALNAEHQKLEAQIRVTSPRYAALVQPRSLTLAEIQTKLLDNETLLLEYSLGSERSFLWVVSHNDIAIYVLPKRAIVEDAARNFYKPLMTPASEATKAKSTTTATRGVGLSAASDYAGIATTLSQMLLAPALTQLGAKRLVIVADGAVQYIPFAALPEPNAQMAAGTKASAPTTNSYQPLIVNHEVVSLPSASTLAVLRDEVAGRLPAPKTVAVLADPVFEPTDLRVKSHPSPEAKRETAAATSSRSDPALRSLVEALKGAGALEAGQPIPRLPFSRREALSIVSLVPEPQRKLVLDFDANHTTATSAELSQYRFLHFATHGLLDSTHPELSGVLLSLVDEQGRPQPQGLLRLGEIYNLKLPVELVVLSACQTALGQEVRGEGLVGLTRGFMYAGAPRVVASLWKVDDKATADLMKIFYEGMLGPQRLPAAAALRQAQKQVWQSNKERSPFYWAAFVLQGEWR
jgi:CHAT domain-containing protein/Tfp pilus assembly protein PilF